MNIADYIMIFNLALLTVVVFPIVALMVIALMTSPVMLIEKFVRITDIESLDVYSEKMRKFQPRHDDGIFKTYFNLYGICYVSIYSLVNMVVMNSRFRPIKLIRILQGRDAKTGL